MNKEKVLSIVFAIILALAGTITAYFKGTVTTMFGLSKIPLLIIAFILSFAILFCIFYYLVFGFILKPKLPLQAKEIPKVTSNVKNTFVPGSNVPQVKEPVPKPIFTKDPIKEEVHKDVSLMVENLTSQPDVVSVAKKDVLVVDNTINHVQDDIRTKRRDDIVKEVEAKSLLDVGTKNNPIIEKTKEEQEADIAKFKKLSKFDDVDKK